jgi:4-hydroxy 2-oxovalerate aldolase
MSSNVHLLDCTLRDGGYINDWKWGYEKSREIIRSLTNAGINMIEVGFLRNVASYDKHVTVCNRIEELNLLLPDNRHHTMYTAMAMCSNYDLKKLVNYSGQGIEMIRITAHDYDIDDGLEFARIIHEMGYKVSINPINIMGYADHQVLDIVDKINKIAPTQFSIVDTFGSMKRRDLDRLVSLVDHNLEKGIRLGLHLHENMALSFSLAQHLLDENLARETVVDASLLGMGRVPGNLPIELIADYMNDYCGTHYDLDSLMDAIQDYIQPIKEMEEWGYSPSFFLSAKYNLHRNYAEHFLAKGDLSNRDINYLLSRFDVGKATVFDAAYADNLYEEYRGTQIDDSEDWHELEHEFRDQDVLVVAPGASIATHIMDIKYLLKNNDNLQVIAVNFIPPNLEIEYAFFSNNKRIGRLNQVNCKLITTSNVSALLPNYRIDYHSLTGSFAQGCNSLIMLLKMLKKMQVKRVYLAGADGYTDDSTDYYDDVIGSVVSHDDSFNESVSNAMKGLQLDIVFVTPSAYQNAK